MASDQVPAPGGLPLPPDLSPRPEVQRQRRRSRQRRAWRASSWLAVVVGVLVLALGGGAFGYLAYTNNQIARVSVFPRIPAQQRPAKAADGAENILLVGNDSRVGATKAQLAQELTTADGGSANTDTIIVLHIAPDGGPVTMVSFPRDSYVAIPGHGHNKINSAYADGDADHKGGGPALLVETVENLSGLRIDHYVQVGLTQFVNISNAIGGVQVCLTAPARESNSGINLPAGRQQIQGSQALAFVRQRYGFPDGNGDLDRIKRQQRFVTALVNKARSIRSPSTFNALLQKTARSLTVDSGASGLDLLNLAARLRGVQPADVRFVTVPLAANKFSDEPGAGNVVNLDHEALPGFFAALTAEHAPAGTGSPTRSALPTPSISASPTPTPAPRAAPVSRPPIVAPSTVTLVVLNGGGVQGQGGATRDDLAAFGFQVTGLLNAPQPAATTTIRYPTGAAAAAAELARALPGATLVQDETVAEVEVTIGVGFGGVQDPATATSATPSASARTDTSADTSPSGSAGASPSTSAGHVPLSSVSISTAADSDCGP